jgi:hypothetical protein
LISVPHSADLDVSTFLLSRVNIGHNALE